MMSCLFCGFPEPAYRSGSDNEFICSRCIQPLLFANQEDLNRAYVKAIEMGYSGKAKAILMHSENQFPKNVDDILTEKELIELLGIKKSALDDLRYRHKLPFCKVSNTNIYLVKDVLEFIASKRMVLNKDT
jgi:hypothetical protein